jgi:hypothetical protein
MPTNSPTSVELLAAVQEFLRAHVLPQLTGSDKYHLQVSLNALAILAREFATAGALDDAEQARLHNLLGFSGTLEEGNRALCARITERKLTYRDNRLMDHLWQTAIGKMSIDNPRYATYVNAIEG